MLLERSKKVCSQLDRKREAIASLATRQLFPTQVKPASGKAQASGGKRVRPQAMSQFYLQLASLLRSGVPLLRSLEVIAKQSTNPALKETIDDIPRPRDRWRVVGRGHATPSEGLQRAGHKHRACRRRRRLFLREALERVAKFTDQQAELKSRVMGALAYPIFLAVFSVGIVAVLVVFFVPKFETLFGRLRAKGELPFLTDWLLALSEAISNYGLLIALSLGLAVLLVRSKLATESGRWMLDRVRLRAPQAGPIYRNLAVSRFCRVLGTLLSGGVPIVRALKISSDSTGNRVLSDAINKAADNITAGESLATPLQASGQFPSDVVEMVAVAEQSNTLETVLTNIADTLERQTWRRLDLLVRLVEPVMLLVMASAVLVIVVALLLPMLKSAMAL